MKLRLHSTALDGRTVTLSVMQEGVTVGPLTINAWGSPLSSDTLKGSITVAVTRTPSMTAPESVDFRVTGWDGFDTPAGDAGADYDPRDHDIVYLWDLDDPTSTWTSALNVLAEWKNPNVAQGPFVGHVYGAAGTYTPSCLAIELSTGRTATYSTTITVADPNVTFAGAATAYVAPDGDYAQAPAGAGTFTGIAAAIASVKNLTSGGRIMFARDKTFLANKTSGDPGNTDFAACKGPMHFVAGPGAGADPILQRTTAGSNPLFWVWYLFTGGEATFANLDMRLNWDSTTETGHLADGIVTSAQARTTVHRCKINGAKTGITGIGPRQNDSVTDEVKRAAEASQHLMLNDCILGNWQNYGVFASGIGRVCLLGARIAQHVDARSGGPRGDPRRPFNNHGAVRFDGGAACQAHVDGCDMYSRTGWWENFPLYRTIQACLRWNQSSAPGAFLNLQRTSMEGGYEVLALSPQNDTKDSRDVSVLIDHCAFTATHMSDWIIKTHSTGFTLRNSLLIVPNTPRQIFKMDAFIRVFAADNWQTLFPNLYRAPLKAYGNTYLSLQTAAVLGTPVPVRPRIRLSDSVVITGEMVDENYIDHQPGASTPQVAFAPLDTTPLWTPREKGPQNSWELYTYTLPSSIAAGGTLAIPYPAGRSVSDYEPQATQKTVDNLGGTATRYEYRAGDILMTNTSGATIVSGKVVKILLDRSHNPLPRLTTLATPAGSVWNATPQANSIAIGGATSDDTPYDDIRLRIRPVHAAAGAVEI